MKGTKKGLSKKALAVVLGTITAICACPGAASAAVSFGSYGSEVSAVQQRLFDLGYMNAPVDGAFGYITESAVIAFQTDMGLYVDGVVGAQTMAALGIAQGSENTEQVPEVPETINSVLAFGSYGSQVVLLQQKLSNLGFYSGTVDGDFGNMTYYAVTAYQSARGLFADGVAGPITLAALFGDEGTAVEEGSQSEQGTAAEEEQEPEAEALVKVEKIVISSMLSIGSKGSEVAAVQQVLKNLGYLNGLVDGDFGNITKSAVEAFQRDKGLYVDGVVGNITINALNGEETPAVEESSENPGAETGSFYYASDIAAYVDTIYANVVDKNASKEEQLWQAFQYVGNRSNYPYVLNRIPYNKEMDWPVVYAHDMMYEGASSCQGYAALFGYMASKIGYDAYWVYTGEHAWVEIDGLMYDPVLLQSVHQAVVFGVTREYGNSLGYDMGYADYTGYLGTYHYVHVPTL